MRISPYSVTLGGIEFGSLSPSGVFYNLEALEGWDSPGSTGTVEQRTGANGGWASRAFLTPRLLRLTGGISVADESQLEPAIDALLEAVSLDEPKPIEVTRKGATRIALVRQDDAPAVEILSTREAVFDLAVIAPNALRFSKEEHYATTFLPSSDGGLALPTTVPFSIEADVRTGFIPARNAGNVAAPAIVRIHGPVSNPSIANSTTGQKISFGLDLGPGEFLDIDLGKRTALMNGQASRRGFVTGSWWLLEPGSNSIAFTSPIYDPSAYVALLWRDAWK